MKFRSLICSDYNNSNTSIFAFGYCLTNCSDNQVTDLPQAHRIFDDFDLGLSDHHAVVLSLHTRIEVTSLKVTYKLLITEVNVNNFNSCLSVPNWD